VIRPCCRRVPPNDGGQLPRLHSGPVSRARRLASSVGDRTRALLRSGARQAPDTVAAPHDTGIDDAHVPRVRWGHGRPVHPALATILDQGRDRYQNVLEGFLPFADALARIPIRPPEDPASPRWHNAYFFGLDAVALYGILATRRPGLLLEVGSGHSTLFARRAIVDEGLVTRIVSVDPQPRADVDAVCDQVIRVRLEDIDLDRLPALSAGDILFLDGSHLCRINSDVTVAFCELIPALAPGVLVHIHDIFLPSDYPPPWLGWNFSEQYLLAAQLLAGATRFEVLLPAFYVHCDPVLSEVLTPLWERVGLSGYERAGHSMWLEMR